MNEEKKDDPEIITLLTEIKAELVKMNSLLENINQTLQNDRTNLWKILMLTIMGAFALIGIKLAFP
jgi:uncharacterized membrane protein